MIPTQQFVMFVVLTQYIMTSELHNGATTELSTNKTEADHAEDQDFHSSTCPTHFCECRGKSAECSGWGKDKLTFIPKLPDEVKYLYFTRNDLHNVSRETFKNISHLKIEVLSLMEDNISVISEDAFEDLNFLKILYMDRNPKLSQIELSKALESVYTCGPDLSLDEMDWKYIPENMFLGLSFSNISFISLRKNNLERLNCNVFSNLTSLNELDLSMNKIYSIHLQGIFGVEYLYLSNNVLFRAPKFQDYQNEECYLPYLIELHLDDNNIYLLNSDSFYCLPRLERLILNSNPILNLGSNIVSGLNSLTALELTDIGTDLEVLEIDLFPFNSSSLTTLKFGVNEAVDSYRDATKLFRLVPNLKELYFSGQHLPVMVDQLHTIFPTLAHLDTLSISYMGIREMPKYLFEKFPRLRELNLQGNLITSWDGKEVFGNASCLNILDISYNNIAVLNKTSFPENVLTSLTNLDLSGNRLACTCDNLWFRNFIRNSNFTLMNYPDDYPCEFPPTLKAKGVLFDDYNPTVQSCKTKTDIILVIAITLTSVTVIIVVTMISLYKCRWHIRYLIFKIKWKRKLESVSSDKFLHDGFVIYCDDDRSWVHEELLKTLEVTEGFSLCIRLRDFELGKVFVDNITDNMNLSRKIIVVLSNNFVTSEWCRFQLLLAQHRLVNENVDSLVIILLEEVNSNNMMSSIHTLISMDTYITWPRQDFSKKYFWEQVIDSMRARKIKETPIS